MHYGECMKAQEVATFGPALRQALQRARKSQADLARLLNVDPGQVSRWVHGKAVPHIDTVGRIEQELGADLSKPFETSTPAVELYVAAPITGLDLACVAAHHDMVAQVVAVAQGHVNSLYWPGETIRDISDLGAADITTEKNMTILAHCTALLYLQFDEIVRPSGALIELGVALGRRMKTTAIFLNTVPTASM